MPRFNTFVKQIEINSGGGVRITVLKQAIFDDGTVHDHPHQITIDTLAPQDEIDAQIAGVNRHLNAMGYPSIDPAELDWPMRLRARAHELPLIKERQGVEKQLRDEAKAKADAENAAAEEAAKKIKADHDAAVQAAIDAAVAKAVNGKAQADAADHAVTAAKVAKG